MSSQTSQWNYPLFKLAKTIGVDGQQTTLEVAAQGGYKNHTFMAVFCSNDRLMIRYSGESGTPTVRQIPWFKDPAKKIICMEFDPLAKWLLCIARNGTTYLVPLTGLMCGDENKRPSQAFRVDAEAVRAQQKHRANMPSFAGYALPAQDELGPLDDVTVIADSRSEKRGMVTACTWWKTWDGEDFAITADENGFVSFLNLNGHVEQAALKLSHPVTTLDIVVDTQYAYKYLLIHSPSVGHWRLPLEQELDGETAEGEYKRVYTSLPGNLGKQPFVVEPLQRFKPGVTLSLHYSSRQGPVVGVYHPSTYKFEVYDASLSKFALYVFQLFPYTKHVLLTDKFTFIIVEESATECSLLVISNLIAGTTAHGFYNHRKDSIMQKFKLSFPCATKVLGIFPPAPTFPSQSEVRQSSQAQLALDHRSGHALTFSLWTSSGIYDIRPDVAPEIVFDALVFRSLDAEPFGKTVGLDLYQLYENAADALFAGGNFQRALDLYALSNVDPGKVVHKCFAAGQEEQALDHLINYALTEPAGMSIGVRKRMGDLAFICYVQLLLAECHSSAALQDGSSNRCREFAKFLADNADYDAGKALVQLAAYGWTYFCLLIGAERKLMPTALSILANRGAMHMDPRSVTFLTENGYGHVLVRSEGGAMFRTLEIAKQVELFVDQVQTVTVAIILWITPMLPFLASDQLLSMARAIDPRNKSADLGRSMGLPSPRDNQDQEPAEEAMPSVAHFVEMFVTVLLALNFRENNSIPDNLTTENYGEEALQAVLKSHRGQYNACTVLSRCTEWSAWEAAAAVHTAGGNHAAALQYTLRAIAERTDERLATVDSEDEAAVRKECAAEVDAAQAALLKILPKTTNDASRSTLLSHVLRYWHTRRLAARHLESMLLRHLSTVGPALGILLEKGLHPAGPEKDEVTSPLLVPFSADLYLRVTQLRAQSLSAPQEDNALTSPVWTNIKQNLSKDIGKRSKIVVPNTLDIYTGSRPRAGLMSPAPGGPMETLMAFTCGHNISKKEMFGEMLPKLRSLVEQFPSELSITLSLIMQDYHQERLSGACPICVYKMLRSEQVDIHGITDPPLVEWRF